jgi:hypothetical protein
MNKNLIATLASLLALAALAAAPAAQAAPIPHWYSEGKLIVGETVPVKSSGTLTFFLTQYGVKISCKVTDTETIENPAAGGPGQDLMTSFRLSRCKPGRGERNICEPTSLEIVALGLSWKTHLAIEPPAPGVRDVIEGIALEFKCSAGPVLGVVTGTLNPKVGNSVLAFAGGKALSGPFGPVTVKGSDKLTGPPGDLLITAK